MSIKTKGLKAYPTEIPSREDILAVLAEEGVPVTEAQLCERLRVAGEAEREGLARRVAAMEREGEVMRNRRGALLIPDKAGLVKGKVIGHPDGFGFLKPDDGRPDLFLGPKQMHKALHGDVVLARVTGVDRRGREEGSIVEVLERANRKVVGRIFIEHGVAFLIAENKRINQDILITPDSLKGAKEGQVVVAEIIEQPTKNAEPIGRVVEILGNYADPGMEIEIALRKHDLPHEWPRDALAAAARLPKAAEAKDLKARKDLRKLPFVTIDGETARDFDDAVYCERTGRDFRLWVAIADVSHYVKPGDALDREALERGNSVYFPRRVIPMLPEELSNELCSLKPDVDRLVMVCEMEVSAGGAVRHYQFHQGVIHSQARLTYTRVAAVIEGREAEPPVADALVPQLETLYAVFRALLGARQKRGAIDFETVETQMIFDAHGKIEQDRARAEERRAPPDRGVHARGQRERLALPRAEGAARALPRPRGAHAREARGAALDAQGLRAHARGRRQAPRQGLRAAACAHQGQALRRHAADGDAALALAGGVQPGERGPLRARVRRVRALHLADPPLPRPARAPRDQGGAEGRALRGGRPRRARAALLRDRAARRRRHARRRGVAQVLLHAGPRGRGVRRAPSAASPASACS